MTGESPAARDVAWMRRALANAEHGWGQTAPNPMVGAVVVSGHELIADGWHSRFGEPHAEVIALRAAGGRARGATLYVTLEPCTHHGKTPPCVDAIIAAGVARVVIAVRDPNPEAAGGVEKLRAAGIEVDIGVEEIASRELNAPFFNAFGSDRPWVVLKMALSADGAVADPAGKRRWITSESSRRQVHRMRANADAVAVGIGTVLADDPDLTVRDAPLPRRQPTRIVFDSTLRIPTGARVIRTARDTPTIVVARVDDPARRSSLEAAGVQVLVAPDLEAALRELRHREIRSILLEGGPTLAGAFLHAGMVDRLAIFAAPVTLGPGAPLAFAHAPREFQGSLDRFPVVERKAFDEDSFMVRAVRPAEGHSPS
jgi:diaminohydroxyphosphoribosylaminopyrimidine deaminase/5-amino-6-(5-phosphoribosylamino)uracil reductase